MAGKNNKELAKVGHVSEKELDMWDRGINQRAKNLKSKKNQE